MNRMIVLLLFFALFLCACERDPAAEVRDNLINAMTNKLQKDHPANASPFHFKIVDVAWFEIGPWYRCEFKVKLTRPDGTDTTGTVKSKISKDYSVVVK